jgi:hypothetical protein
LQNDTVAGWTGGLHIWFQLVHFVSCSSTSIVVISQNQDRSQGSMHKLLHSSPCPEASQIDEDDSSSVGGGYSEIWLPPLTQVTPFVSQNAPCHIASIRTISILICFLKSTYAQCRTTFSYLHSTQVRIGLNKVLKARPGSFLNLDNVQFVVW